ncbi:hypothetical protein CsatB_027844 [Cannabis sativa]
MVTPEVWAEVIAYWKDPKQQARAKQNAKNRGNMKVQGGWGSKTIVSTIVSGADPQTGELPSAVDTFVKFHCKNNKWRDEHRQQLHAKMVEIRDTQPTPADAPRQYSVDPTQFPADTHIMTQVLGERSRHLRGVGPLPRLKVVAKRATPRPGASRQASVTQEEYEALKKRVEEQEARIQWQQQMMMTQNQIMGAFQQQMIQLASAVPGFNMPDLPPIPPIPPFQPPGHVAGSSSQAALPVDDEDDAVDL